MAFFNKNLFFWLFVIVISSSLRAGRFARGCHRLRRSTGSSDLRLVFHLSPKERVSWLDEGRWSLTDEPGCFPCDNEFERGRSILRVCLLHKSPACANLAALVWKLSRK